MYFRNYGLSKTWLDLSPKSPVSEHPSIVNMLKGAKHLWNLHERTFISFFHHFWRKWFGKYLPYWSLKSQGSLLRQWQQITSILFRIVRICCFIFKCKCLKNEKRFLSFLFHLWNLHQISNIFSKRKWSYLMYFRN